ncbi:araC family transcriptional regulator [Bordetella pertussis]|nr:araC family transcriptional regulator [Bordetella pertussis]
MASRVTLATPGTPYLCFALDLDPHRIAGLISELGAPPAGQPLRRGLRCNTRSSCACTRRTG